MAKAEWGAKRQCPNCGAKFYDLNKSHPITCPKCAHQFEADVLLKPRKAKLDLKDAAPVVAAEDEGLADTEADTEETEEAADEELESEELVVEEELEEGAATGTEATPDLEDDDVVLEDDDDDDDIDEALIEGDEDLGDEEVVDIPDPEEEKDL